MRLCHPASTATFLFGLFACVGCSAPRHDTFPVVQSHATSVSPQAQPQTGSKPNSKPKTPAPKRTGPVVFLDPGHGGRDCGAAVKFSHLQEKALALEVARRAEKLLAGWNYNVSLSRRNDVFVPLQKRVSMALYDKAEIFVSVHFNSASSKTSTGAEIYFYNVPQNQRSKDSKRLGSCILRRLCEGLPTKYRGVKHGDFCVIRETAMPAVLVEAAFITNTQEAKLLASSHYKQKIAAAIAKGINDYFRAK
jgi:N-acetylmuramoyl-L-alanine amidase